MEQANFTQCDPTQCLTESAGTLKLLPHVHIVAAIMILVVAFIFHFLGQLLSVVSWKTAVRFGLQEASAPADYYPYEHGSAIADVLLGWTYPLAAIGLLKNAPWGYKLAWIPGSVLVYHSLSSWFWEEDRRAAGHQMQSDALRIIWCSANFFTGVLTLVVAWAGPTGNISSAAEPKQAVIPLAARVFGNAVICIFVVYMLLLASWQSQVLRGRAMRNPDGSSDNWRVQKTHYGLAFADLYFAFPACMTASVCLLIAPRWGYFGFGLLAFWFTWASLMTTATSLRFEKSRITLEWLVVFPFGIVLGAAYLIWLIAYFDTLLEV